MKNLVFIAFLLMTACTCYSQVQVGPSFGMDMTFMRVVPNGDGYLYDRRPAPVMKVGIGVRIDGVVTNFNYNWEDKVLSVSTGIFFDVRKRRRSKGKCYKF